MPDFNRFYVKKSL